MSVCSQLTVEAISKVLAYSEETYCPCGSESIDRYVRYGSKADIPRHSQLGPLLGAKRT